MHNALTHTHATTAAYRPHIYAIPTHPESGSAFLSCWLGRGVGKVGSGREICATEKSVVQVLCSALSVTVLEIAAKHVTVCAPCSMSGSPLAGKHLLILSRLSVPPIHPSSTCE